MASESASSASSAVSNLLEALGDEVQDVDEDLGMLDARAESVVVTINGVDYTIKQSPAILRSNREAGTTGAAVWRASVKFAEWLALPSNVLFKSRVLDHSSAVMELGSGISALVPLGLRGKVDQIIATDQQYALKLLRENLEGNPETRKLKSASQISTKVKVLALDWETDDVAGFLRQHELADGVDAILICDCVFNYALVQPLADACTDICTIRRGNQNNSDRSTTRNPTLCIIAQQLRQPDVFEHWLTAFLAGFRVWRLPDALLTEELRQGSGFAIHIGIPR